MEKEEADRNASIVFDNRKLGLQAGPPTFG